MATRKSNIEVLRIICMAVIVLNHYVSRSGIVETFGIFNFNNNIAHLFRSTGYPCLVTFVLISGYFMAGEGIFKARRIIAVLIQVTAFSLILLLIGMFVLQIRCDSGMVIRSFIPYLYGYDAYWFVGPYLAMCLLAPFMDMLMDKLNMGQHKMFLLLSILIVFIIPTNRFFSMANERNGVLTFLIIYTIAGYIKKYNLESKISGSKLLVIIMGFLAFSYSTYPLGHLLKVELYNIMVLDMNNIFSLVIGVGVFLLFLKIPINTNRVINYFAGSMFGVYLFHDNFILRDWIWGFAVNRSAYYTSHLFLVHCFLTVLVLFTLGICFDIIISFLIKPVINSAVVNKLSVRIDERVNSSFRVMGEGQNKI